MNNINSILDEKKKKEKRKKIIKLSLIFIVLALILTWFVASFVHNKPNNNDEFKSELVLKADKNYSKRNNDYDIQLLDDNNYFDYSITLMNCYSTYSYNNNTYTLTCYCDFNFEYDFSNSEYITASLSYWFDNGINYYSGEYYFDVDDFNISTYYYLSLTFNYSHNVFSTQDSTIYYEFSNDDLEYYVDYEFPLYTIDGAVSFPFYNGSESGFYSGNIESDHVDSLLRKVYSYGNTVGIEGYEDGYHIGYDDGYDIGYDTGYREGDSSGYSSGYDIGYDNGYEVGITDLQKQDIATKGFKTLFNVILNAPYNIYSKLLNFEFLGINLFNLFSFIVTTCLIMWIIKLFKK